MIELGPAPNPTVPDGPGGLLLSRDLIFTSKITGTAAALGYRVIVVGDEAKARELLEEGTIRVVFVDLAAGNLVGSTALLQYQEVASPGTPFVAFGSHVDTEALANARAAGCDPVLPRSRFTVELPALIQRYFGGG